MNDLQIRKFQESKNKITKLGLSQKLKPMVFLNMNTKKNIQSKNVICDVWLLKCGFTFL